MEQWYRSIISGERVGIGAATLRFSFAVISWFYALVVVVRNRLYDAGVFRTVRLGVPVIAVGNITTGGTGKTPTVIMVVKELVALGRRPAVLTRGYGAAKGQRPDEAMVIENECPGVPVIVNPDRVAGGREAIAKYQADVLVMDDGFQHRRLARDLNIVLVDATEPMGIPGVVPRGSWREPPGSLARADIIMLTRCEQVDQDLADLAAGLLMQWVPARNIYQQETAVLGVFDAAGNPVPLMAGGTRRVLAFAGLGNPNGFLHTVRSLGFVVAASCWFDDHHGYETPGDFAQMMRVTEAKRGVTGEIDAWITTLKDWVKLRTAPMPMPVWHVRIEARLPGHQAEVFRERLAQVARGAKTVAPVPDPLILKPAPPSI